MSTAVTPPPEIASSVCEDIEPQTAVARCLADATDNTALPAFNILQEVYNDSGATFGDFNDVIESVRQARRKVRKS